MKAQIVLSKKGNAPITVYVIDDTIGMSMLVDDFLAAMAREIGNPALLLTNAQLLSAMQAASVVIQTDMKQASVVIL